MALLNSLYPESKDILEQIESLTVSYIDDDSKQQVGVIEVHSSVVDDIQKFFSTALELRFPIHSVNVSSDFNWDDDILTANNITSAFNYRLIKDTDRPSLHAQGLAFDVNPLVNPYIRFSDEKILFVTPQNATYDTSKPGTLTATHPLVVLMKNLGWEWGGDWTKESGRIDYQHFQKPPTED